MKPKETLQQFYNRNPDAEERDRTTVENLISGKEERKVYFRYPDNIIRVATHFNRPRLIEIMLDDFEVMDGGLTLRERLALYQLGNPT